MLRELKKKKWEKENIKTPEEKKRDLKIHKKETKKYRGIEYDLICLESDSGSKWVALESKFKFPDFLIYDLNKNKLTGNDSLEDFLWYDSGTWNKYPIEYQWKKMDKIAKSEIDGLYKIYENIDDIIKEKINLMNNIKQSLKDFIEKINEGSE